jgi:O-antigen/teichoic acid export membrane protein
MGAVLLLVLGWAEYASSALRSMGSVYLALLPRDIVWRGGTLLIAGIIMWSGKTSDFVSIAAVVAGVLVAATIPQTWALVKSASGQVNATPEDRRTLRRASGGLWGITALSPLLTQGVTLLIAGAIGPSAAGAFFAAERSALLVSVALGGINQVLAPHISKAFHAGRIHEVQRTVAAAAAVGGGAGLIFLLVFLVLGNWLLEFFDPTYSNAWIVLIILAAAQVFNAAAGPTIWLLQVTGRQNAMLKYLLASNAAGAFLVLVLSHLAGMIGAAIGISVTVVLWNSMAILDARKHLGIDPSLAGMFRRA